MKQLIPNPTVFIDGFLSNHPSTIALWSLLIIGLFLAILEIILKDYKDLASPQIVLKL
jgi:hypothetical protein